MPNGGFRLGKVPRRCSSQHLSPLEKFLEGVRNSRAARLAAAQQSKFSQTARNAIPRPINRSDLPAQALGSVAQNRDVSDPRPVEYVDLVSPPPSPRLRHNVGKLQMGETSYMPKLKKERRSSRILPQATASAISHVLPPSPLSDGSLTGSSPSYTTPYTTAKRRRPPSAEANIERLQKRRKSTGLVAGAQDGTSMRRARVASVAGSTANQRVEEHLLSYLSRDPRTWPSHGGECGRLDFMPTRTRRPGDPPMVFLKDIEYCEIAARAVHMTLLEKVRFMTFAMGSKKLREIFFPLNNRLHPDMVLHLRHLDNVTDADLWGIAPYAYTWHGRLWPEWFAIAKRSTTCPVCAQGCGGNNSERSGLLIRCASQPPRLSPGVAQSSLLGCSTSQPAQHSPPPPQLSSPASSNFPPPENRLQCGSPSPTSRKANIASSASTPPRRAGLFRACRVLRYEEDRGSSIADTAYDTDDYGEEDIIKLARPDHLEDDDDEREDEEEDGVPPEKEALAEELFAHAFGTFVDTKGAHLDLTALLEIVCDRDYRAQRWAKRHKAARR